MTIKISVEVMQNLTLKLADYIGPGAFQYVKLLSENADLVDAEWTVLADMFSGETEEDILEEVCFQAMNWGITDVRKMTDVIVEIEKKRLILKKIPVCVRFGDFLSFILPFCYRRFFCCIILEIGPFRPDFHAHLIW